MATESRLLPEDTAEEIVRLGRTTMGDSLRSITYFTRDDYDQLYLRSDLERDADLSTFVGYEWRDFKTARDAYTNSELGAYEYTIRRQPGNSTASTRAPSSISRSMAAESSTSPVGPGSIVRQASKIPVGRT